MLRKKLLATKLGILEFIMNKGGIYAYELIERFHYSENCVPRTLYRLRKAGLIINLGGGDFWELTDEGYRKLRYYGKR